MSIHPDQIERGGDYLNKGVKYTRTDLIPAMIQAAVDAEREACAMVAAMRFQARSESIGAVSLLPSVRAKGVKHERP